MSAQFWQFGQTGQLDECASKVDGLWLPSGDSQIKGFRPLLDVFFPSIYRILRASHSANRWCIINQMFANSLPVDARIKNYH